MKKLIIEYVQVLLLSAKRRKSFQGVKVYEMAIDQLQVADSDIAVLEILSRLKAALIGIETHGFFPPDEYEVVKKVLALP
jgi:hypothetical protein